MLLLFRFIQFNQFSTAYYICLYYQVKKIKSKAFIYFFPFKLIFTLKSLKPFSWHSIKLLNVC